MDTLELIRTFREVAHRGSFSMAARTLDVSKANVSKYVAELETRLGVRLLNRTTRTVSLTDAGSLLLARSTPLVEMIDLTREELQHRSRLPSGRVRVTAPIGLAHTELPRLLGEFMVKYPEVNLSLQLENRMVDLADEGIDIALRIGRITDSSLIVRRLQQLEFVVVAAPAYWERRGMPEHPDDLADHDALTLSFLGARPEWRFEIDGEAHTALVRSRMDATDVGPLLTAALQGLGMVNVPRLLVEPHLGNGALQQALHGTSPRDVWLFAAYSQRRHNSAALKALLAFLEEHLGQA